MIQPKDYGETNFITGMRAFAAFAVLLIHSGGAGLYQFGNFAANFVSFGRTGVYAFFVISGYSIAVSYTSSGRYFQYLNRRMWRIAPIYYFWLIVALVTGFAPIAGNPGSITKMDANNVLMHLSFLSFLDYKITNSILGVEWSISIEVFWYLVVPLMLFFIRGRIIAFVLLALAINWYRNLWIFPAANYPWQTDNLGLSVHFSAITYLPSYCMGIAAFRFRELMPQLRRYANWEIVAVFLACIAYLSFNEVALGYVFDEVLFSSGVTALLIVFGTKAPRVRLVVAPS